MRRNNKTINKELDLLYRWTNPPTHRSVCPIRVPSDRRLFDGSATIVCSRVKIRTGNIEISGISITFCTRIKTPDTFVACGWSRWDRQPIIGLAAKDSRRDLRYAGIRCHDIFLDPNFISNASDRSGHCLENVIIKAIKVYVVEPKLPFIDYCVMHTVSISAAVDIFAFASI